MQLNKARIQKCFAGAVSTYDSQAVIQLKMAEKLLHLLGKHLNRTPELILEIGCCTGLLTAGVYDYFSNFSTLYVNDLVPDFAPVVAARLDQDPRLVFLPGDIETMQLPTGLDLVISSSTLHWLEDLPALFFRLAAAMTPEATFCFSIYGPQNLREVREITGIGLKYYSPAELKALVGTSFEVLEWTEEAISLSFSGPLDVLRHLRETGVHGIQTVPWTRSRLERFRREYRTRFSQGDEVQLTYHPVYCIARKKTKE